MARVRVDEVEDILEGLRQLPELTEVKPAVFYVKRTPFLHFHESATTRGVDVRDGKDWGERIELPVGRVSKTAERQFLTRSEATTEDDPRRVTCDAGRPRAGDRSPTGATRPDVW